MKNKVLVLFIIVFALQLAHGVDMKGKIGFGTGTTRFGDILRPSLFAMRFGVSEKLLIEPWLDITKAAIKMTIPAETTYYTWDTIIYPERQTELSLQNTGLGLQGYYAIRSKERTNLYGIGGIIFGMLELKSVYKEENYKYTGSVPIKYLGIPIGIGGEYFLIEDHMSVNINAKCGFGKIWGQPKSKSETSVTIEDVGSKFDLPLLNFGNSFFDLFFMWYF